MRPGRLIGLAFALALVACGTTVNIPIVAPGPTATPGRVRTSPPGTVTIGLTVEPSSLAAPPVVESWGGPAYAGRLAANLVMAPLVSVDDRGQPFADLAQTVPTLENGGARFVGEGDARQLQTTFKLRPGGRWSDGQPLTARDVVFTWQLALNPLAAPTIATAHRYEKVEAPDDSTVVFTMFSQRSGRAAAAREPNSYGFMNEQQGPVLDPLYAYGLPGSWIVPEHTLSPLVDGQPRRSPKAVDLLVKGEYARRPVGAGPFALQEWQPGQRLVFAARRDYARGAPKVGSVVLTIAPPDRLRDGLADGAVDLLTSEGLGQAPPPARGVQLTSTTSTAEEGVDVNLDRAPLRDLNVREALLRAIDRAALATPVGTPPAVPTAAGASATAAPAAPGAIDDAAARRYPFDPARAGELLDGAGLPMRDGRRVELKLLTTDDPERARLAGLLRDQLGRVGVVLSIEARPAAELFDPRGRLARRDFDLALYGNLPGLDRLADLADRRASAAVPGRGTSTTGANYPGLRSPALDAIFAVATGTLERARRDELLRQADDAIAAELPRLPLYTRARVAAASPELRNLKVPAPPIGETWNAYEWDVVR